MAANIFPGILFAVVEHTFALLIIAALLWQLYCCIRLCRRHPHLRGFPSDDHLLSPTSPPPPPPPTSRTRPSANRLRPSLFKFLPTFTYSDADAHPPPQCAICTDDFQEGDVGRLLPNCNHFFHLNCIDKWLRETASTCPMCRKLVDPPRIIKSQRESTETSAKEEGRRDENLPPPIWCRRKTLQRPVELEGVAIEIPEQDDHQLSLRSES